MDVNFNDDNWYNISLNLSKNGNVRIYKLSDKIEELSYVEFNLPNYKNIKIDKYQINGSEIDLRNIRLFNCEINDKDKQLINLISQFSNDESKLIIADNVDEFEHNSHYGTQR